MANSLKLKVAPSHIHGQGLFTHSPIEAGTTVGLYKTAETEEPGDHTLWLESGPVDVTCDLRFINHSKAPNVAYYDDGTVVALRQIEQGEELTHDYGSDWD